MTGRISLSFLAALIPVILLLSSCSTSLPADVVAGTSLISDIAQDVSDGKLGVHNLMPPGMCPGHYDVKPGDVETLANSKALIIHDWQQDKANIKGLMDAADNPDLIIEVVDVQGNWMVPQVQAEATIKIAQALGEMDPKISAYYQQNAEERTQEILAKGEELQNRLLEAEVSEVQVVCSGEQAGFVEWAGFDVVATYGRPEELSVVEVDQLVTKAKEAGVALVIDNLQSGATATSESMAQDIGAIQVTISNFPGGLENTETWEKAIDRNVDLILAALAEWREEHG